MAVTNERKSGKCLQNLRIILIKTCGGTDPFLAPTKQSLELVIIWTESPPRAQMAMRAGMIGANIPNMRSANVTAIASLASMADGLRTAR